MKKLTLILAAVLATGCMSLPTKAPARMTAEEAKSRIAYCASHRLTPSPKHDDAGFVIRIDCVTADGDTKFESQLSGDTKQVKQAI